MRRVIIILSCFCYYFSCTGKTDIHNFSKTETLKYIPLISNENIILKPLTIEVFDSILFVCDPYENNYFTVIDINLFRGGRKGQGPDEFLYPVVLNHLSMNRVIISIVVVVVCILVACRQKSPYEKKKEKVINSWIGREIQIPNNLGLFTNSSNSILVFENYSDLKIIHIMNEYCASCGDEVDRIISFINRLSQHNDIPLLIVARNILPQDADLITSSGKVVIFSDSLDLFTSNNRIVNKDIVKTILLKGNEVIKVGDITSIDFQKRYLNIVNQIKPISNKNQNQKTDD